MDDDVHPPTMGAIAQIDSRPLTRNQRSLIGLVVIGNVSEFFDLFLIGFVVSLLTKPWHLTGLQAGIILAGSGLGTVLGAILWGRLADQIGRRRSFFWCVLLFTTLTFASMFTPERGWLVLAVLRVGVGIGVGGLNISSIPYVQEFVPARQRGLMAGLASVFIPVGLFLGAQAQQWLAEPLGWRGLIALGVLPGFLLIWLHFVPESPRYLQANGRIDDARAALAWALRIPVAEVGPIAPPPVTARASFGEVLRRHSRSLLIVTFGSFCFILGTFRVQSWGQTLLGEGYGFDTATVGFLFTMVALADVIGRLGAAWLADVVGRRVVLFTFAMIGAAGALTAALAPNGWTFFVGILVTMMFGDGVFGILNAFGAEQFPNHVRATGLGLGYGIGATAKVVGPATMGALIGGGAIKQNVTLQAVPVAFTLFAILLVAGGVIYLFAKETKAVSLDAL